MEEFSRQNTEIKGLQTEIHMFEYQMMPIGSIVAWSGTSISNTEIPQAL